MWNKFHGRFMTAASRWRQGLFTAALALPACAVSPSAAEEGALAVLEMQRLAWNRGDIEAFMNGYHRHPGITFFSSSGVQHGWEDVLARYLETYPDRRSMGELRFGELEVRVLAADAVHITGGWSLERTADRPAGVFSLLLTRIDGAWKIVHDHTSRFAPRS